MRCEHCGFISFEHNNTCPSCGADLSSLRRRMGIYWEEPDTDFHKLFDETPSVDDVDSISPIHATPEDEEAELEFDVEDDFEFSLDE